MYVPLTSIRVPGSTTNQKKKKPPHRKPFPPQNFFDKTRAAYRLLMVGSSSEKNNNNNNTDNICGFRGRVRKNCGMVLSAIANIIEPETSAVVRARVVSAVRWAYNVVLIRPVLLLLEMEKRGPSAIRAVSLGASAHSSAGRVRTVSPWETRRDEDDLGEDIGNDHCLRLLINNGNGELFDNLGHSRGGLILWKRCRQFLYRRCSLDQPFCHSK